MNQEVSNALIGRTVQDRYRILGVLGEGGMGTVYEAEHVKIGRRVALKTLLPSLAQNPQLLARFHREAQAASTIGHPSIVDVTDMGELPDGSPFLVMEKLVGEELAEYAEVAGPLRVADTVRILRHVCSALHAAHEAGIVHRDLKPSNIFLVAQPEGPALPKVLDFGISKFSMSPDDQGLTATGVAVGTPAFMSPEQAQGLKSVDRRTDIYAMGVIAYQLLTGRLPFSASSYAALLIAILTVDPKPIGALRSDLPQEMSDAIMRAMSRNVADRFQTVAEFGDALAPFASHNETPVVVKAAKGMARPRTAVLETGVDVDASEAGRVSEVEATRSSIPETSASMPQPSTPTGELMPPMRKGPPKVALALGAGLLLALGVGGYIVLGGGEPATPAPTPVTDAPSEPVPEPATEPVSPETVGAEGIDPPAAATEVRVRISVRPSEAQIFLNGVPFPNPMDAQQLRSLTPTTLRVEAAGYRTLERVVILDDDQTFDFELAAAPSRPSGRRSSRPNTGTSTPAGTTGNASGTPPANDGVYRGQQGGLRREL